MGVVVFQKASVFVEHSIKPKSRQTNVSVSYGLSQITVACLSFV